MFHPRRREQSDWSIRSLKVCMHSAVTDAARFQPGRFVQEWNSPCCHALCSGEPDRLSWDEGVAVSTRLSGWTQPTGPNDAQEATGSVPSYMPMVAPMGTVPNEL